MAVIQFRDKKTGQKVNDTDLFIMHDKVWRDNNYTTESQEHTVDFEDFIDECPDIYWVVLDS